MCFQNYPRQICHLEKLLPAANIHSSESLSEVTPNLSVLPLLHQCSADNEVRCTRLIHCAEKQFPPFLQKLNEYLMPRISLSLLLYELSVELVQFSNVFI